MTRALADLDLELGLAKVSTLGAEVVDSFYVRTAGGHQGGRPGHPARRSSGPSCTP